MSDPLFNESLGQYFDRAQLYEKSEFNRRSEASDAVSGSVLIGEFASMEDRYTSEKFLNEGGLKRIFSCRDNATGRLVAKAVLKKVSASEKVELFMREARITASLQHPNIVPVYDLGLDSDLLPFFTMKIIEGDSLKDIIDKIRDGNRGYTLNYPLAELIDIFLKICDAVSFAHSKGVVHLDLKPDNIRVSGHGEVLLVDWGLARKVDSVGSDISNADLETIEDMEFTQDGQIKGTPGYMAPEQASGDTNKRSRRTDVYSLGAILYAILSQKPPICGSSIEKILDNTIEGRIRKFNRNSAFEIPQSLQAICLKALSLHPQNRYYSVEKLQNDILAWKSGFAAKAENAGFVHQLQLLYNRNKNKVRVAILMLLIIVGLATAFIILQEKDRARTEWALQELRKSQNKTKLLALSEDVEKSWGEFKNGNTEKALNSVAAVLHESRTIVEAHELKGLIHLAKLEIKEAAESFGQSSFRYKGLHKICKSYMSLKRSNLKDFLPFLKELLRSGHKDSVRRILSSPKLKSLSLNQKVVLAKSIIYLVNDQVYHRNLKMRIVGDRIDIDFTGTNNRLLTEIDGLQFLPIRYLNISETAVKDLTPLAGTPLETLVMLRTPVVDLTPLKSTKLKVLSLEATGVRDLSPLKDLPVEVIKLGFRKADLSVFRGSKTLRIIDMPKNLYTKDEFKDLPPSVKILYRSFTVNNK